MSMNDSNMEEAAAPVAAQPAAPAAQPAASQDVELAEPRLPGVSSMIQSLDRNVVVGIFVESLVQAGTILWNTLPVPRFAPPWLFGQPSAAPQPSGSQPPAAPQPSGSQPQQQQQSSGPAHAVPVPATKVRAENINEWDVVAFIRRQNRPDKIELLGIISDPDELKIHVREFQKYKDLQIGVNIRKYKKMITESRDEYRSSADFIPKAQQTFAPVKTNASLNRGFSYADGTPEQKDMAEKKRIREENDTLGRDNKRMKEDLHAGVGREKEATAKAQKLEETVKEVKSAAATREEEYRAMKAENDKWEAKSAAEKAAKAVMVVAQPVGGSSKAPADVESSKAPAEGGSSSQGEGGPAKPKDSNGKAKKEGAAAGSKRPVKPAKPGFGDVDV